MSATDQPITQKQRSLIREEFQVFRKLPGWMITAWDSEHSCAALAYQILKLK